MSAAVQHQQQWWRDCDGHCLASAVKEDNTSVYEAAVGNEGNVQSEDQDYCLALQSLKSLTVVCSSSSKVKEHKVEVIASFLPISADEEESNAETRYFALLLRNRPLLKYHTHDRRS